MSFSVTPTYKPLHITCGGSTIEVEIRNDQLIIDGKEFAWSAAEVDPGRLSLLLNGQSYDLHIERDGADTYAVTLNQKTWRVRIPSAHTTKSSASAHHQAGLSQLNAPMPGTVRQVLVEPGDSVEAGQGLIVLEAMKMENELRADGSATVQAVHVEPGQAVTRDALLIEFEA